MPKVLRVWAIALLFVALAAAIGRTESPGEHPTMKNSLLTVVFEQHDEAMRLRWVESPDAGISFSLAPADPFQIVAVTTREADDPDLEVHYAFGPVYRLQDVSQPDADTTEARYEGDLVDVTVRYTLEPEAPVIRKTILCTAKSEAVYLAGLRLWCLTPENGEVVWPTDGAFGQPIVVVEGDSGYFVTLEWPRAQSVIDEGAYSLEYRPGMVLEPGDTAEVAAGSIGLFAKEHKDQPVLSAARLAFFDHVTRRVKPDFPFPVKFTTWGPWMGQADALRILRVVDDLEYVGTDLLHFDAGWQESDHPYTEHFLKAQDASDEEWDLGITNNDRLPNGLLPLKAAADRHGMKLSLWLDACGCVFMREIPEWAAREASGARVYSRMWENRTESAPRLSLAGEYGTILAAFVREIRRRYDLGGIMFDNNGYPHDIGPGRRSLANGWNSEDVQLGVIMDIFDEANRDKPGIYRFYCNGAPWAWSLLHATHIHGGDPGTSGTMRSAAESDYPARALAFERRRAWQRYYTNFVPPWGVKGDIAGWSMQQQSPIPINLDHTDLVVPCGEGWVQNLFTCFAVTAVRDIRFSFDQMPAFDRDILKKWLAWDRGRSHYITNLRPVRIELEDPDAGACVFSHVGNGEGVLYAFNQSLTNQTITIMLDERAGFTPGDHNLSAYLVSPVKAPCHDGAVSYGDTLSLPVIAKDCVVIEIGLPAPRNVVDFSEYEKQASSVVRTYSTYYDMDESTLLEWFKQGTIALEAGDLPQDGLLARQIVESIGAWRGKALDVGALIKTPPDSADVRILIGTHEGLKDHELVGERFRETLSDRYIEWEGKLISGPLVAVLPGADVATLCLIAPRPEQLARLAKDLAALVGERADKRTALFHAEATTPVAHVTCSVPAAGRPALAFRPIVRFHHRVPFPNDMDLLQFEIWAEDGGERRVIWRDSIPPFQVLGNGAWWDERFALLADCAGKTINVEARVSHADRLPEYSEIGFQKIDLLRFAD